MVNRYQGHLQRGSDDDLKLIHKKRLFLSQIDERCQDPTDMVLFKSNRIGNSKRQIRDKAKITILPCIFDSRSKSSIVPNIVNRKSKGVIDCSAEDVGHENDGDPGRILKKIAGEDLGKNHRCYDENLIWIFLASKILEKLFFLKGNS